MMETPSFCAVSVAENWAVHALHAWSIIPFSIALLKSGSLIEPSSIPMSRLGDAHSSTTATL